MQTKSKITAKESLVFAARELVDFGATSIFRGAEAWIFANLFSKAFLGPNPPYMGLGDALKLGGIFAIFKVLPGLLDGGKLRDFALDPALPVWRAMDKLKETEKFEVAEEDAYWRYMISLELKTLGFTDSGRSNLNRQIAFDKAYAREVKKLEADLELAEWTKKSGKVFSDAQVGEDLDFLLSSPEPVWPGAWEEKAQTPEGRRQIWLKAREVEDYNKKEAKVAVLKAKIQAYGEIWKNRLRDVQSAFERDPLRR